MTTTRFALLTLLCFYICPNYGLCRPNSSLIVKWRSDEHTSVTLTPNLKIQSSRRLISASPSRSLQKPQFQKSGFDRIFMMEINEHVDVDSLVQWLQRQPEVEYAQLNHVMNLDDVPNDSLLNKQWYMDHAGVMEAWATEQGNPDVLIGIIDTGIDYNHVDLLDNLWVNPGEDLNGNGLVDQSDFDEFDNDGNGFVDDLRGWDFTDAPHFPDGGDYRDRDNNPADEHGHGTTVAGIVGAVANNHIGIAGIAHGCKLLNLRAGTSQGLLEEDDVASAIVYAVDVGARVVNMSFGDVFASPLLHDVMQYAFANGCVLIASAGNSSSDQVHYPSGYHETISVGAVNNYGTLASFSNYGQTVDLVAPGVDLMTTDRFNSYRNFSGTSAAAPVVTGIAALLISRQPELSPAEVRNILVTTTTDRGEIGWDDHYASGEVHAGRALTVNYATEARISEPQLDAGYAQSPIVILGTAAGALMSGYELAIGEGENPETFNTIYRRDGRQVVMDSLGIWNFQTATDTSYTIRLTVFNKDGTQVIDATRVFIDRTDPAISEVTITPMLDAKRYAALIQFTTDDLCKAELRTRILGSTDVFRTIPLEYITLDHQILFQPDTQNSFEFEIFAENRAGLNTIRPVQENPSVQLTHESIRNAPVSELSATLPSGYMLPVTTDWDGDGLREVVLNPWVGERGFNNTALFEYYNGAWNNVFALSGVTIPRDVGDSDGDGLKELFVGVGPKSMLYESPVAGSFPSDLIWEDDNDAWASRITDLDGDGVSELLVKSADVFELREYAENHQYQRIAFFPNPTEGANSIGVPHSTVGDFDGDGKQELLLGDSDGDVFIYESTGNNQFSATWSDREPLVGCDRFTVAGDFDGDGVAEFAIASHSSSDISLEHEYDSRHWLLRIYDATGNNDYQVVWEQAFFGYDDVHDATNGLTAGDIDNEGIAELLVNMFPDFYVIDFGHDILNYLPVLHLDLNFSQLNIVGDVNQDGVTEFAIDNGNGIRFYSLRTTEPMALRAPDGFTGWPLDTNSIYLEWQPGTNAVGYIIYRGETATILNQYQWVATTHFIDTADDQNKMYWYAIAADFDTVFGRMSEPIAIRPDPAPRVSGSEFMAPNQVRIVFSEPMDATSIRQVTAYKRSDSDGHPQSVIVAGGDSEILLTFGELFKPGSYVITAENVRDQQGTPIDGMNNSVSIIVTENYPAPYLVNAEKLDDHLIELEFSQAMDPTSISNISHYSIVPEIPIECAALEMNPYFVRLTLMPGSSLAVLGKKYIINVTGVESAAGISITRGAGSQASLVFFQENLDAVFTYPNPVRVSTGQQTVTFANLTQTATIHILTTTGTVIRQLEETDGDGGVEWDLRDNSGQQVRAGVYIYYVKSAADSKVGKLAIVK
ncbi:S8 family serine peptidase [candidate division KSB1 bacterium]|nr:S8 family serine peptidase [candidate division KSB1 bacterium]